MEVNKNMAFVNNLLLNLCPIQSHPIHFNLNVCSLSYLNPPLQYIALQIFNVFYHTYWLWLTFCIHGFCLLSFPVQWPWTCLIDLGSQTDFKITCISWKHWHFSWVSCGMRLKSLNQSPVPTVIEQVKEMALRHFL